MRRNSPPIVIALAVALLNGCVTLRVRGDWPVFRGDQGLSGVARGRLPDTWDLLWSFRAGDEIRSSPVTDDRRVFVGSMDGKVYAVDKHSGEKLWEFDTGDSVEASPLVAGGAVFVGAQDGAVLALNATNGLPRWKGHTGGRIAGSADWLDRGGTGDTTSILVGSYDNTLYCLDSASGATNWAFRTENFINGTASVSGGKVLFGGCDARVHVLDGKNGQELLSIAAGSYVAASVAAVQDSVYLGHYDNKLIAADVRDGRILWEYGDETNGAPFFSSPAVGSDRVIVGSRDKRVHCVSRASGRRLWVFPTRGEVDSSPVICGDKVVVGSGDGRLYILRLSDGSELWSYETGGKIIGSPAVDGGVVFVGSGDGRLHAFGNRGAAAPDGEGQPMRIVQIVPGSGGHFYCENCLRDVALVRALRELGHDVILVPMYLPMSGDDRLKPGSAPLFYGALSLYLKQQFPSFRKAPAWLSRMLDAPQMLRWIARNAKSTRAASLEELTLSMLRGEEGNQALELGRLVDWLKAEARPDVVHLSNALLLGLARRIRTELQIPIVCSLQDEDAWVEAMSPDGRQAVWNTMAEKAETVDAFVAVSRYYAGQMQTRLRLPDRKLHVVYIGIDLTGAEPAAGPVRPPAVGYLSRMAKSLGLDMLVDAFIRLKEDSRLRDLRLKIMGGQTADDHEFIGYLRRRMDERSVLGDVEISHGFSMAQRREFLRSISVLSVPVPGGLAFGMCQLEAMACGVPVVQPREGAFPELIEATGGGLVYHPNDVDQLADSLASLLLDHDRARELGRHGRAAVLERFSVQRMAADTLKVYEAAGVGR